MVCVCIHVGSMFCCNPLLQSLSKTEGCVWAVCALCQEYVIF